MEHLDPDFLLSHEELVAPVAPWCLTLDNLELGIVLLAQPWVAGGGLRRADLERQLARLGQELPLGQVYFQRVNRAVAKLEAAAVLRGDGSGRSRRFLASPEGFGALVLNLRVLRADPTVDGSEFELKRALVAMCTLFTDRLAELPGDLGLDPQLDGFFDKVEALEIWGRGVITDELAGQAFDVLRLIEAQRQRVQQLLNGCEGRLAARERQDGSLRGVDLAALLGGPLGDVVSRLTESPQVMAAARELATIAMPELSLRAAALRYRRYLAYLDDLTAMYAAEIRVVSVETVRQLAKRVSGVSDAR